MATLVIPGAYMASLHFTVSGQEIVNVIGVSGNFLSSGVVAKAVGDVWTNLSGPHDLLPAAVVLSKVKAVDIGTPTGEVFEQVYNKAGGGTTPMGPLSSSAVVRAGASTRSRSGKGRLYYGPLPQGMVHTDGRTLTPSTITALNTRFTYFKDQLIAREMNWVILSRKLLSFTPVETVSVAQVLGTQRRRLR